MGGAAPPGWVHLDGEWDGVLALSFGAGVSNQVDAMPEPAVHLDAAAAEARARRLTPEPKSLPRKPLSSGQSCLYDVAEGARWRGGTNMALAAALLRLPFSMSVRGIACQWEIHDLLHGMPDQGVDSLRFEDSGGES